MEFLLIIGVLSIILCIIVLIYIINRKDTSDNNSHESKNKMEDNSSIPTTLLYKSSDDMIKDLSFKMKSAKESEGKKSESEPIKFTVTVKKLKEGEYPYFDFTHSPNIGIYNSEMTQNNRDSLQKALVEAVLNGEKRALTEREWIAIMGYIGIIN